MNPQHSSIDPNTGTRWHILSTISHGDTITEVLAAAAIDGIAFITRWKKSSDGSSWKTEAMESESGEWMTIPNRDPEIPSSPPVPSPTVKPIDPKRFIPLPGSIFIRADYISSIIPTPPTRLRSGELQSAKVIVRHSGSYIQDIPAEDHLDAMKIAKQIAKLIHP